MQEVDLNRFDLNLLVVFDTIAGTRSVTLAADRLSLSQPAISHALKRLRTALGDQLFVRGRDGLVLTQRAEAMLPAVGDTLAALRNALSTPRFDPTTTVRRFGIAASDYSLTTVMPSVMQHVRREAPNAVVEISHSGPETLAAMEDGELDLSFWGAETPSGPFQTAELFRENYVGLVCARHPIGKIAGRSVLTAADYVAWPHVIATVRDSRPSPVDVALRALGLSRRIALVSPNFLANMASLPGTDLIMSVPSRLARAMPNPGLRQFPLPFQVADYPYSIVWHAKASADPGHRWLRETVMTAAALA